MRFKGYSKEIAPCVEVRWLDPVNDQLITQESVCSVVQPSQGERQTIDSRTYSLGVGNRGCANAAVGEGAAWLVGVILMVRGRIIRQRHARLALAFVFLAARAAPAWACEPYTPPDRYKTVWPSGTDAPIDAPILLMSSRGSPTVAVRRADANGVALEAVEGAFKQTGVPRNTWKPATGFAANTSYQVSVTWAGDSEPTLYSFTTGTRGYRPVTRAKASTFVQREATLVQYRDGDGSGCVTSTTSVVLAIVTSDGFEGDAKDFILPASATPNLYYEHRGNFFSGLYPKQAASSMAPCVDAYWEDPVTNALVSEERLCSTVAASLNESFSYPGIVEPTSLGNDVRSRGCASAGRIDLAACLLALGWLMRRRMGLPRLEWRCAPIRQHAARHEHRSQAG